MRTALLCLMFASAAGGQTQPAAAPPAGAVGPVADPLEQRAGKLLAEAVADKNPDVRKQAAQSLGLVTTREPYISMLKGMLNDKDVEVRIATVTSLGDLRDKSTLPALEKALDDPAPEVSFAAAKALWTLDDPGGKRALLAVLGGESKTSSGFLTSQKRDTLRMFHTPRTLFMFALKQGIGAAPVPGLGEGVSSIQGILSDAGISGRASAALLLGRDKDPDVLPALRDALSDKDASVRAAAAHSIAVRNDPELRNDLTPLLDDKREAVRLRAAAGYLRLAYVKAQAESAKAHVLPKAAPKAAPPSKQPVSAGIGK
jgi:HEAT repeat protein